MNTRGLLFDNSTSTSWQEEGLYALGAETNLPYTENYDRGNYGYDTLGLGHTGSGSDDYEKQVVASIATPDFYVGHLGLNPQSINFTTQNDPSPSLLTTLKTMNRIPSLSYGYSAGAEYRESVFAFWWSYLYLHLPVGLKKVVGTLTLGGTDTSRYIPNDVTFSFASDISRDLVVGLQSIQFNDGHTASQEMLPSGGILTFVDSTVPHIWLPLDSCQQFERYFGIDHDNNTDLYLVNASTHSRLLRQNASLSFQLGNDPNSGTSTTIAFPYASFDLTVSDPVVNTTTHYFPIRRAANNSQYTLGRAFLQESYLTVDYERRNFSISQAAFPQDAGQRITPVLPINATTMTTSTPSPSPSSKLSSGVTAGIAIGVVILCVLILLGAFLLWRRRRRHETFDKPASPDSQQEPEDSKHPHGNAGELQGDVKSKTELPGVEGFFASTKQAEVEGTTPLSEKSRAELEGDEGGAEMEGSPRLAHEMPGSAMVYEMDAGNHGLNPMWTPRQGTSSVRGESLSPRSPRSPGRAGASSPPAQQSLRSRYNVSPLTSPVSDGGEDCDHAEREAEGPMSFMTPGPAPEPRSSGGTKSQRSDSGRRSKWGFRRRATDDNPGG